MLTEYFGNYLQASYEQNSFLSPAVLGIKCDKKLTCIRSKTQTTRPCNNPNNRELKKTAFLTTRTLTGNKLHVFNQS